MDLKSSRNGSIGIDPSSKKEMMKKYLFVFENELVKVEKMDVKFVRPEIVKTQCFSFGRGDASKKTASI